jgi:uncharacterized membrane protein
MISRAVLYDLLGWIAIGEAVGLCLAVAYLLAEQAYRRRVLRRAARMLYAGGASSRSSGSGT